jgi:hypothetical protein
MNKDTIVSVKKIEDDNSVVLSYEVVWDIDKVTFVPNATDNTDYQAIQEWVAAGNTIQEAD